MIQYKKIQFAFTSNLQSKELLNSNTSVALRKIRKK